MLTAAVFTGVLALSACGDGGSSGGNTFTAGSYSATVEGRNDDITVTVTVNNSNITSIDIDHSETPNWVDEAFPQLIDAIMDANSANVDYIAGATISTQAVIEAVRDALDQARN